ncbi:hypothetical protein AJ80_00727 [Polytolypa hystricis UAMH7299]|uniref:Uncharacterized protein n=1 Tax=Polytolypa hystricis (strain UAMH7299) TaxID=1447883 RepID=A0A2B7Z3T5_POLH7|nr:hypothetical protein AJ80_00727 [Polytolypa hystricis UAMH7299]
MLALRKCGEMGNLGELKDSRTSGSMDWKYNKDAQFSKQWTQQLFIENIKRTSFLVVYYENPGLFFGAAIGTCDSQSHFRWGAKGEDPSKSYNCQRATRAGVVRV